MDECRITLQLSKRERRLLDELVRTGLYGPTRADAAERLIAQGIEERMMSGLLDDVPSESGESKGRP